MKALIATTTLATFVAGVLFISSAPADPSCGPSGSGATPPDSSQLGHPLNYVLIQNCQGGSQQLQSHLQVTTAYGQDAQPTNLAYAYSYSCSPACESVAVAYQVALVDENNSNQAPQNAAVAINDSCDGCATFAYADQYAVDVAPGTRLSSSVRHQLHEIGQQADQDIHAGLPFSDLDSKLRALATQIKDVVDDGLQQARVTEHRPRDHQEEKQTGSPDQDGSAPGSTTTSGTSSTSSTSSTTSTTSTTSATTTSSATTSKTSSATTSSTTTS